MAPRIHTARILLLATIALAAPAHGRDQANYNRTVGSVHQPVVSRTDYSMDVFAGPGGGLAPGEAQRLDGWFDALALGYGDTVTVDRRSAQDGVGKVLSRYGMLVSQEPAPASAGQAAMGSIRVVVSRAVARVDGCPDWSRGNYAEYEGANTSNFGCATAKNLAAMIANPQDLVEGARAHGPADGNLSVKAITAYRQAEVTGKAGLKAESAKGAK